jgi:hypothetical protein
VLGAPRLFSYQSPFSFTNRKRKYVAKTTKGPLKSKQTSITTIPYPILSVARLPTPLIFHYPLPLNLKSLQPSLLPPPLFSFCTTYLKKIVVIVDAGYCGRRGRVRVELQKSVDAGVDRVAEVSRRGKLAVQCSLWES